MVLLANSRVYSRYGRLPLGAERTPEGKGYAPARLGRLQPQASKSVALPVMEPSIKRLARSMTVDLLGFWLAWHLYGGFEGLVEMGMHPSTVWRKVPALPLAFGQHPDGVPVARG